MLAVCKLVVKKGTKIRGISNAVKRINNVFLQSTDNLFLSFQYPLTKVLKEKLQNG